MTATIHPFHAPSSKLTLPPSVSHRDDTGFLLAGRLELNGAESDTEQRQVWPRYVLQNPDSAGPDLVPPSAQSCAELAPRIPCSRSLVDSLGLMFAGVVLGFAWKEVFSGVAALVRWVVSL